MALRETCPNGHLQVPAGVADKTIRDPTSDAAASDSRANILWGAVAAGMACGLLFLFGEAFPLFGSASVEPAAVAETTETGLSNAADSVADSAAPTHVAHGPPASSAGGEEALREHGGRPPGEDSDRAASQLGPTTPQTTAEVQVAGAELPFYVNGISFQRDSNLAAIWGNDSKMRVIWDGYKKRHQGGRTGFKFLLGVYDWRERKVLRREEIPIEIDFAAISASGIYAIASNPPRLIRFDYQTLKPIKQIPLKSQALRVVAVADRYLAVTAYDTGARFEIPSLRPIQPGVHTTSTWLAGQFGDGWMWEGVYWDKPMRQAKLFAMPIAFGAAPRKEDRGHISGFGNLKARPVPCGPMLYTLHKTEATVPGSPLPDYPGRLVVVARRGQVVGEVYFDFLKKVSKTIAPERDTYGSSQSFFAAHGPEHSAVIFDGKIHMIPYTMWELPPPGFNFKPIQSTFLLNPSKSTPVRYLANGATKFRLKLVSGFTYLRGNRLLTDSQRTVLFEAESNDGSFDVAFDSIDSLVASARRMAGCGDERRTNRSSLAEQQAKHNAERLAAYREQVMGTYRGLTGQPALKTPVPVYAYVTAENADGEQAALFHAYLVDIDASRPAKQ